MIHALFCIYIILKDTVTSRIFLHPICMVKATQPVSGGPRIKPVPAQLCLVEIYNSAFQNKGSHRPSPGISLCILLSRAYIEMECNRPLARVHRTELTDPVLGDMYERLCLGNGAGGVEGGNTYKTNFDFLTTSVWAPGPQPSASIYSPIQQTMTGTFLSLPSEGTDVTKTVPFPSVKSYSSFPTLLSPFP